MITMHRYYFWVVFLKRSVRKAPKRVQTTSKGYEVTMKCLAVDDQSINLSVLSAQLRSLGCEVQTATTGEQAVNLCHEETFDLVLMDVNLPGIDGIQATHAIRSSNTDVSIVAVSGDDSPAIVSPFDQWLTKPISKAQISTLLDEMQPA